MLICTIVYSVGTLWPFSCCSFANTLSGGFSLSVFCFHNMRTFYIFWVILKLIEGTIYSQMKRTFKFSENRKTVLLL